MDQRTAEQRVSGVRGGRTEVTKRAVMHRSFFYALLCVLCAPVSVSSRPVDSFTHPRAGTLCDALRAYIRMETYQYAFRANRERWFRFRENPFSCNFLKSVLESVI